MKLNQLILPILAALALSVTAHAHGKKEAGPNGGRLLTAIDPHAEFLVTAERKVQITFLDENDQPVAATDQVVTVFSGDRSAPAKLSFTKSGRVLISDLALPAGNELPTVVQIKTSANAKTVSEKFNVSLAKCPECKNPEYACTCGH